MTNKDLHTTDENGLPPGWDSEEQLEVELEQVRDQKSGGMRTHVILGAAIAVLAVILGVLVWILVSLYSPKNAADAVFADGTTVNGQDVSGLTAEEAELLFRDLAPDYSLTIALEGAEPFTITAAEISLSVAEEPPFADLLKSQQTALEGLSEEEMLSEEDLTLTAEGLVIYDADALAALLDTIWIETNGGEAVNATLTYDESAEEFVIVPEEYGGEFDAAALLTAAEDAIRTFSDELELDAVVEVPNITSENEALLAALEEANACLDVELTYTFAATGGKVTITRAQIAGWLTYDEESVTVSISNEALQVYVSELADTYSVSYNTSKFKTVSGSYITVKVASAGETVDSDALYNDIYDCLTGGISGTRAAPYDTASVTGDVVDFGGNYVEVDLTNQHLYVFVNGAQVMDSAIVSGKVSAGCATPTGVYTIKSKETDRYLTGATYRSWVNYWMPFNGGIGFHDATWRSNFGGTIYQYSGSHGCVNMPLANAKKLYGYISVGYHVVVYGGVTSVPTLSQTVTVTPSYSKTVGDADFNLDAKSSGDGALTYVSSNTNVATVDSTGKVTVMGAGTATITITATATNTYKEASATTTVTVAARHTHSYTAVTTVPTCTNRGFTTYTCSCGDTYTGNETAALGHSYTSTADWAGDHSSCTITITCSRGDDSHTLTATVTTKTTDPTETTDGETAYTATATYNGVTYTDTRTVTIPATGSSDTDGDTDTDTDTGTGSNDGSAP